MYYASKPIAAHRFSFMKAYGLSSLRSDQFICHKCDNPRCVNPDHLFLGTALENMRDKVRKGRHNVPIGSKHGQAKLSEEDVKRIRSSTEPATVLAKLFNVHPQHIRLVRRCRRVWSHV